MGEVTIFIIMMFIIIKKLQSFGTCKPMVQKKKRRTETIPGHLIYLDVTLLTLTQIL